MSIGRELLLEVAPDAGENPLGLLGLSPEVLRLKLTDAELYSVCKRFARTLLAEVHEDRVAATERTRYLQVRFSQAMVALRDEATFSRALLEFRHHVESYAQAASMATRNAREYLDRLRSTEAHLIESNSQLTDLQRKLGVANQKRMLAESEALKRARAQIEIEHRIFLNRRKRRGLRLDAESRQLRKDKADFRRRLARVRRLVKRDRQLRQMHYQIRVRATSALKECQEETMRLRLELSQLRKAKRA